MIWSILVNFQWQVIILFGCLMLWASDSLPFTAPQPHSNWPLFSTPALLWTDGTLSWVSKAWLMNVRYPTIPGAEGSTEHLNGGVLCRCTKGEASVWGQCNEKRKGSHEVWRGGVKRTREDRGSRSAVATVMEVTLAAAKCCENVLRVQTVVGIDETWRVLWR